MSDSTGPTDSAHLILVLNGKVIDLGTRDIPRSDHYSVDITFTPQEDCNCHRSPEGAPE